MYIYIKYQMFANIRTHTSERQGRDARATARRRARVQRHLSAAPTMQLPCPVVRYGVLRCVAVCCIVLQCVAVCCSVLQCVAVCVSRTNKATVLSCCEMFQCFFDEMRCVAVCCGVSRCVAVCCSVLQCVSVCCHALWMRVDKDTRQPQRRGHYYVLV